MITAKEANLRSSKRESYLIRKVNKDVLESSRDGHYSCEVQYENYLCLDKLDDISYLEYLGYKVEDDQEYFRLYISWG